MEKQYCRVGTVTPIAHGNETITMLEYQYQHFLERASMDNADQKLRGFFELKAQKIKKLLENLV
ncbi:MAG: hypothetical protein AAGA86_07745 [Bacteroidota bacterium]